jgi:hypothetical protein
MSTSIAERIQMGMVDFLSDGDPKLGWLRQVVREQAFLPLYIGWSATLGIRPDGSMVRWEQERSPPGLEPLLDPYWQRTALCQGMRTYPALGKLLPNRPAVARTCEACGGTGAMQGAAAHVICDCGGIGWVLPGEIRGPAP